MRLAVVSLCCVTAFPAQADMILPGQCYLRQYSRDHLVQHPDQRVTQIAVGPEGGTGDPILRVAVMLRGDREVYSGAAYCTRWGRKMDCAMEGDMGAFTLEPAKDGAVRLSVGSPGMSFEGTAGFIDLAADRGDDRVFLIPPVPADACP
jgi:hypothetical protein